MKGFNMINKTQAAAAIIAAAWCAGCAPQVSTDTRGATPSIVGSTSDTSDSVSEVASPRPGDFRVDVLVTEQKCFGSAGCSYHYTIDPHYTGTAALPTKTTVVFKVTGGDQTQIGNFSIDKNGTATFDRETTIDGPEGANLQATVTQVIGGR
ncbi:hypothetical protein NCCNTM_21540 [Mycolicibacterium sp. NCC-Tsukiji]|nr:hypothetical protein NCCNTM_21540 [Mycolicibacterium sp. NCC-Tsukiji]